MNSDFSTVLTAFQDVARLIANFPTNEQKPLLDALEKAMNSCEQLAALERLQARIVLPTPAQEGK